MDKQQLAAEFNWLTNALAKAATNREIGTARIALEMFTMRERVRIDTALTEWAQTCPGLNATHTTGGLKCAECDHVHDFNTDSGRCRCGLMGEDDLRCRTLDEGEQACRARADAIRACESFDANPMLVARANEADDCADAIARLKEET